MDRAESGKRESAGRLKRVFSAITRTQTVFNQGVFLSSFTSWAAHACRVAAVIILILKVTSYHLYVPPVAVLLVSLPFLFVVPVFAMRSGFSKSEAAAWLDLKSHAGGSIMALTEETRASWQTPVTDPEQAVPVITLSPVFRKLAVPVVFLAAVMVVPGVNPVGQLSAEAIKERVASLEKRIESVRRLGVISQKDALRFEETARCAADKAMRAPEAACEAVDAVQSELERKVIDSTQQQLSGLDAAQKLTPGESGSGISDEILRAATSNLTPAENIPPELQKALEDLAKQCGLNGLSDLANLKADMLSGLSPEDQKKLLEALKQCRLESLKACRECIGALTDKEAKEILLSLTDTEKPGQECNLALLAAVEAGREPGRGGVDRGPGEAPLVWSKEPDTSAFRFKPMVMEPGQKFIPGAIVSKGVVAPERMPPGEFLPPTRTGALAQGMVGGMAPGAALGPYNRKVAERYFESEEKKQ